MHTLDALNKVRYPSLSVKPILETDPKMKTRIVPDRDAKTLVIQDSGISMTKSCLINNMSMIAKSGTKRYIEALAAGVDASIIGQFGVGLYSFFLVADNFIVYTKHNDDRQYEWESSAGSSFTTTKEFGPKISRGAWTLLQLKNYQLKYLEESCLKHFVKKHFSNSSSTPPTRSLRRSLRKRSREKVKKLLSMLRKEQEGE